MKNCLTNLSPNGHIKLTSLKSLSLLASLAGALALSGCSGGSGGGNQPPAQTFTSAVQTPIGNGLARGFVTLEGHVPQSLGFTVTPGALTNLPAGPAPAQFVVPLPPEASANTPFSVIAVAYFVATDIPGFGHVPAHFSPLVLINPPAAPDPPAFLLEQKVPAANELAQDHVSVNVFVPGLGSSYDDPAQPQRQPNWNSTGQSYFYYNGHMNGYGLGATIPFLQSGAARSDVIKQPILYPKPGYYAHRHTVSFDAATNLYTVALSDFRFEDASHSIP